MFLFLLTNACSGDIFPSSTLTKKQRGIKPLILLDCCLFFMIQNVVWKYHFKIFLIFLFSSFG